jgi:hypothetical protein
VSTSSFVPLLHVCVEERVRVRRPGGSADFADLLTPTLSSTQTWR